MRAPLDLAQSAGQCSYDPLTTPPIPRAGNLSANAVTTGKDGVIFRPPRPVDQLGHFIAQKEQMAAERISEPADAASGVHANGRSLAAAVARAVARLIEPHKIEIGFFPAEHQRSVISDQRLVAGDPLSSVDPH